jgi:acid phosphatase family membrane protein YuiD
VTPFRVSVVAALVSVALLLVVLELIRSRRLRERYALLWLLTGGVMLVLSVWRSGLDTLAALVGIHYAPSMLFAVAAVFGVVVLLHYSTVISRLSDENAVLAQRVALLEGERTRGPDGLVPDAIHAEGDEARVGGATVEELRPARRHA